MDALLLTVPLSFGLLLWYLSTSEWFLNTSLGEYIFVTRDFYDVNQTAIAYDSTGPENLKHQVSEVFSKHTYGRILPNLKSDGKEDDFFPDYDVMSSKYPYLTHYEYLTQCYLSQENGKALIKSEAATFIDVSTHSGGDMYMTAMKEKGFVTPFKNMFFARKAYKSFHTFGKDMTLLKTALETSHVSWRHFVVNYSLQNDAFYTEIHGRDARLAYGKSYSAREFFKESCHSFDVVCLVQENYQHWAAHGKLNEYGKRGQIFFHPFKIIRWNILDDVDCWNDQLFSFGGQFAHVNAIFAALHNSYFCELMEKIQVPIILCPGFWSLLGICTLWTYIWTYLFGIECYTAMIIGSFGIVLKQTEVTVVDAITIYIMLLTPFSCSLLF